MSPRKKRKLVHQTHLDEVNELMRFDKSLDKRGIKKFSAQTIDLNNVLDWECDHYEEVYN